MSNPTRTIKVRVTTLVLDQLVTTEESWVAGPTRHCRATVIDPVTGAVCLTFASGNVSTYPAQRRRLGIGCVSGEGIALAS